MLSVLLEKLKDGKRSSIIRCLRNQFYWIPSSVSDDEIHRMYMSSVSLFQSKQSTNGHDLEDIISAYLSDNNISHHRQIPVSREGVITTRNKSVSLIDFVIGDNVMVGQHVSNYVVVSVKKSCRERWLQDEWTFTHKPKKYILFTLSNDYPDPILKFRECQNRLIITLNPKTRDYRMYKLTPDHLLSELRHHVIS